MNTSHHTQVEIKKQILVQTREKVSIGAKQTKTAITKGTAKLVVMATNCPYKSEINTLVKKKNIPIYNYSHSGIELGYSCGKNFPVSVFTVIEEGSSNIMQLVKKRQ